MDPERIRALAGHPELSVAVEEECVSTNSALKERAPSLTAPFALIAKRQTGGRGRNGRSFFSPEGTGLYMSLLIRPKLSLRDITLLTPSAAVAAAEAIEEVFGVRTGIKWVNDIYLGGKKVCGILVESAITSAGAAYAVAGFGVNIAPPPSGFPPELPCAGAVTEKASPGAIEELAAAILRRYLDTLAELPSTAFMRGYRDRLMYVGEEIELIRGGERRSAVLLGCDERGGLTVRLMEGGEETVTGGEITLRPKGAV